MSKCGTLIWSDPSYPDRPERPRRSPIFAARFDEYGPLRRAFHVHALIGGIDPGFPAWCGEKLPEGLKGVPCCAQHSWPWGWARVLPFDPARGALDYVTKYAVKDVGDWELLGLPAGKQLSLDATSASCKDSDCGCISKCFDGLPCSLL